MYVSSFYLYNSRATQVTVWLTLPFPDIDVRAAVGFVTQTVYGQGKTHGPGVTQMPHEGL